MDIIEQVKELREYGDKILFPPKTRDVFNEAADTIESLSTKPQEVNMERSAADCGGGWIPCENRLPEIGKPVLVCDKKGNVCIRKIMRIDELGMAWWSQYSAAIAWQPLPELYRP